MALGVKSIIVAECTRGRFTGGRLTAGSREACPRLRPMAEFQWWLLIVGIVAGAALVAVVFMDGARRDADVTEDERGAEATWIASWLSAEGRSVDRDDADAVLRAHREYLSLPPPDRLVPLEPAEDAGGPV